MTIHFHIPGQPVGKGRPRIGKVGAHARMFTPAKTVSYESTVALFAAQAMAGRPLLTGPVNLQMRVDFAELVKCDGVALLPGLERSRGASLEAHIAHSLGMRLVYPGEQIGAAV